MFGGKSVQIGGKSVQTLYRVVDGRFYRHEFAVGSAVSPARRPRSSKRVSILLWSIGVLWPPLSIDKR